jgi:transcriptional regulator with GAF, ATPase, and Fis domain
VGGAGGPDRPALFAGSTRQVLLPVKSGGAIVAVAVLESRRPDAFESLDAFMLERLAEQAGSVLATRNFLERSRKEIDLLWDVGAVSDLQQELDQSELPELLAKILEIALGRCRMKNGTILLVDEETGDLIIESRSLRGDFLRRPPFRLKRRQDRPSGIAFWVVDHNRPYVTGDIRTDPNYVPMFREVRSNVAVPIPFQDRAIGALVLESVKPDAFGAGDVRMLEDLARQAAKFVRRAQLYRKSREMDQRGIMIRGLCPEWEEAEQILERVSNTGATVLLRGESGTGKELIANALHFNSRRAARQFVVVNCAAIPGELLESELFGHVKGAFTGAAFGKVGELEKADGGTLFLDEIGDLSLPLQVKLLRALQSGEIAKVGSSDPPRRVDVRVIAATNRDLEAMMREGRFREDLYFRLNVVTIWLPPLRRYRDSIPGMVRAFIEEANRIHGRAIRGIEPPALALLKSYDFPGNVRELKNLVERAVILETGEVISTRLLPPEVRGDARGPAGRPAAAAEPPDGGGLDYKEARQRHLDAFEDRFLRTVLARAAGNVTRASELSGIHRVNLHRMLARRGIDPAQFKP